MPSWKFWALMSSILFGVWASAKLPIDLYRWRGYSRTLKLRNASKRLLFLIVRWTGSEPYRQAAALELARRCTDEHFVELMEDFISRCKRDLSLLVIRLLFLRNTADSRRLLCSLAAGQYDAPYAEPAAKRVILSPRHPSRTPLYRAELLRMAGDDTEDGRFRKDAAALLDRIDRRSGLVNSPEYRWSEETAEDRELDADDLSDLDLS